MAPFEAGQLVPVIQGQSGCLPYFAASTRLSEIWISESLLSEKKFECRRCHVMLTCALLLIGERSRVLLSLARGLVPILDSDKDFFDLQIKTKTYKF